MSLPPSLYKNTPIYKDDFLILVYTSLHLYKNTPIYKEDFLILVYTSLHLYKNTPIYKEDFQDPSYLFLCEINSIAYGENKQTAGRLIGKKD